MYGSEDDPMRYLCDLDLTTGHYWAELKWKVPVLETIRQLRIGMFRLTEFGKSYLC